MTEKASQFPMNDEQYIWPSKMRQARIDLMMYNIEEDVKRGLPWGKVSEKYATLSDDIFAKKPVESIKTVSLVRSFASWLGLF